jgi:four helix bundle protein
MSSERPTEFSGKLRWNAACTNVGMDRPELERRSQAFAAAVVSLCTETRKLPGARNMADQLMDAATSVGANYRASSRARSRAEFVAKLGIVAEEIDESVYWLELMARTNVGDRRTVGLLLPEAKELRAIFAASYRTARLGKRHGQR